MSANPRYLAVMVKFLCIDHQFCKNKNSRGQSLKVATAHKMCSADGSKYVYTSRLPRQPDRFCFERGHIMADPSKCWTLDLVYISGP